METTSIGRVRCLLPVLIMPAWGVSCLGNGIAHGNGSGLNFGFLLPRGTASNVIVFLARANVALSVSLTLASTILAIFLTPWLTSFYAGHYVPVDAMGLLKVSCSLYYFHLLWDFMEEVSSNSARQVSRISPFLSVLFILLIVGYVLAAKSSIIRANWDVLLLAVILLHVGGLSWFFIWSDF